MDKTSKKNKGGYTLIEMLFYISLFAIISVAIIDALSTMTKSFRATAIESDLVQSSGIFERISRETRQANNINTISASDLKLNTKDEAGVNKTVRFLLSGSNVQFFENDVLTGNLNTSNVQITALSFTEITTAQGKAIKINIDVRSTRDVTARVESFYNTIVLRGGYGS